METWEIILIAIGSIIFIAIIVVTVKYIIYRKQNYKDIITILNNDVKKTHQINILRDIS